jgi:hypothetical protein
MKGGGPSTECDDALINGGTAMPTKAEIEAELQASDTDRAIAKAREMLADWQEWEALLRAAERKVWQPHWSHDDPLRERLLRVGKTSQEVEEVERRLAASFRQAAPA